MPAPVRMYISNTLAWEGILAEVIARDSVGGGFFARKEEKTQFLRIPLPADSAGLLSCPWFTAAVVSLRGEIRSVTQLSTSQWSSALEKQDFIFLGQWVCSDNSQQCNHGERRPKGERCAKP